MTAEVEPLLLVGGLEKAYKQSASVFGGGGYEVHAVDGIDLTASSGLTLAIVGESGCGKSTFAKVLTGIERATSGTVRLERQRDRPDSGRNATTQTKRKLQMVFQNPDSTLNPSHSSAIPSARAPQAEAASAARGARRGPSAAGIVNLPTEFAMRKPRQLSGGQKQRVAIARALAGDPEHPGRRRAGLGARRVGAGGDHQPADRNPGASGATMLFISPRPLGGPLSRRPCRGHVSRQDRGVRPVDDVFAPPYHPYTEALLSAVPVPTPTCSSKRIILEGSHPEPDAKVPTGCPFATRCPRKVGAICDEPPPEQETATGHRIACHISPILPAPAKKTRPARGMPRAGSRWGEGEI